ncbi:MAG: HDOD domain-containing protein [Candidatus Eisenbacteria bacterium]|uniref:HDOD domain-containing protein n=1 Tax=Eiseniibacteriota bacterium TaxID=2212470 RepID=A0A933SG61_UNCEI|nr:HDOD domain-containing protein [Candidatus Eisenbacteria bacterium]
MVRILFVDDEPMVLDGIRRMLIAQRNKWDMKFAVSGDVALQVCANSPVDIIVTDMRMPEMDGATLLENIAQQYPDMIRVVLSGHSELNAALRAMNVAHQYLAKPCDGPALLQTLTDALALRERLTNTRVRQLANRLGNLPSIPDTFTRINRLLADPASSMSDVANAIAHDPALTGKVLHLANSAFFGPSRHATSLPAATAMLGIAAIRHLVLTAEVFDALPIREGTRGISVAQLQEHSSLVGRIAASLEPGAPWCDDAFAAGLLHDVGILVLAARMPAEFDQIQLFVEAGAPRAEAERAVLGVDHGEIAGYLLGLWGLPATIIEAVAGHVNFRPEQALPLTVSSAVGVANHLARELAAKQCPGTESVTGPDWDRWREAAATLTRQEAA